MGYGHADWGRCLDVMIHLDINREVCPDRFPVDIPCTDSSETNPDENDDEYNHCWENQLCRAKSKHENITDKR